MPTVIPFFNDVSNFREEVILDGFSYLFDFVWNEISEQWSMSILLPGEVPMVSGIFLVLGYNLLEIHQHLNIPQGDLFCIDTTGDEVEITRLNMGDTVKLVYTPVDEL